jgi:hypothetical protein
MLSKLRFSLMRKTMCLIGHFVSITDASTASGRAAVVGPKLAEPGPSESAGRLEAPLVVHAAPSVKSASARAIHGSGRAR